MRSLVDINSEPEFRLLHMAFSGLGCGVGMFLFGHFLEIGANSILCAFFWGIMQFGVIIGVFSSFAYGLDSFRDSSNELFIMNMFFKVTQLHTMYQWGLHIGRISCFMR